MINMKHMYIRFLAVAFSVVFWIVAACGCSNNAPVQDGHSFESQASDQVSVGIFASFPTLPVREYTNHISAGYSCEVKEYSKYTQPIEALTAGEVDVCVSALPSVLRAQLDGHKVKILCNFYQKGSAVVTATEQNITSIEKLAGKVVGYTNGSMEYAQLRADLYNRKIDAGSITWKEIEPSEMNEALQSGTIDAYCGDAALAGTAFMEGYGKILSYPYSSDLGYGNLVLVTTEDKINEKRGWIQEIVNVNYQVMEMVTPLDDFGLSSAKKFGLDAAGIQQERDNYQWGWDIEEEYVMFTRNLCNYFVQMGIFETMPDMNTLFDFTFLENCSHEFVR